MKLPLLLSATGLALLGGALWLHPFQERATTPAQKIDAALEKLPPRASMVQIQAIFLTGATRVSVMKGDPRSLETLGDAGNSGRVFGYLKAEVPDKARELNAYTQYQFFFDQQNRLLNTKREHFSRDFAD